MLGAEANCEALFAFPLSGPTKLGADTLPPDEIVPFVVTLAACRFPAAVIVLKLLTVLPCKFASATIFWVEWR